MTFALTWMQSVLIDAGLKVAPTVDWMSRGRAEMGTVKGVMCHHTANKRRDHNMPSLQTLIEGRRDKTGKIELHGPLCHLGLARDGTFYLIAAGRANHAGEGSWAKLTNGGNAHFIGIEAENSGAADDKWPAVQMDAYQRGVAALLKHIGADASMCCGHKEYAPGRKPDPGFAMDSFRGSVAELLKGKSVAPLIAAQDGKQRPTLRRGMVSEDVSVLRVLLGVDPDRHFGPKTEATLRQWQRDHNLVPDGIAGPRTWATLHGEPLPMPVPLPGQASLPVSMSAKARTVPLVIDISHHNRVTDLGKAKAAGLGGIIHKATTGTKGRDDAYDRVREEALAAGLLWGAYHWGTAADVRTQVDNFLAVAEPDENTLVALDYEIDKTSQMSLAQARQFLELIEQRLGRKAVLYSGHLAKEQLGKTRDAFFGQHRLWICQYADAPRLQPSWSDYWLWQYTDGTIANPVGPDAVPGVPGNSKGHLDCNHFQGSFDDLRREWAS